MLQVARFSDGHQVFYTGTTMKWAWQVYREPGQIDRWGNPVPEMVTGRSRTYDGAEKNSQGASRYELNPEIEIVPIVPVERKTKSVEITITVEEE
tara:strand:+ start:371 stop:655 length:285 start_codon:yes stop_codon:yes gene_type:complete